MCIGATECLNTRVDKLGVFRHWGVPIAALLLVLSGYNYLQLSEFAICLAPFDYIPASTSFMYSSRFASLCSSVVSDSDIRSTRLVTISFNSFQAVVFLEGQPARLLVQRMLFSCLLQSQGIY